MATKLSVANLGLGKLGSATVASLAPPKSSLERFIATGYDHWRQSEIAKHNWHFARETRVLTKLAATVTGERPYQYPLPNDYVGVIRKDGDEWRMQGTVFLSGYEDEFTVTLLVDKTENQMPPLFVEVLAWRVALECVEKVTQSNTKKDDVQKGYDRAVAIAKQRNAFETVANDIQDDDMTSSWVYGRYYHG